MFLSVVLFLIIFVFYLHLVGQYKKGGDMEIYEMDYVNNEELQKVCDLHQPILFELPGPFSPVEPTVGQILNEDVLHSIQDRIVCVKDINDYYGPTHASRVSIYIPYSAYEILAKTDTGAHYFTENNEYFLEETGVRGGLSNTVETFLKPSHSVILVNKYDLQQGSTNVCLPLRFHTNYRQFHIVVKGKITVKMTPYKNRQSLSPVDDYINYERYSTLDVWKKNPRIENMSFLEFDVLEGKTIYIPPYWWYSIKYSSNETIVCGCTYNGIMNVLANSYGLIKYYMHEYNNSSSTKYAVKSMAPPTPDNVDNTNNTNNNTNNNENELTKDFKKINIKTPEEL